MRIVVGMENSAEFPKEYHLAFGERSLSNINPRWTQADAHQQVQKAVRTVNRNTLYLSVGPGPKSEKSPASSEGEERYGNQKLGSK